MSRLAKITLMFAIAALCCTTNAGTCQLTCDQNEVTECVQTKYEFTRLAQTSDYIRVKTPIERMTEVTVCSWITPNFSDVGKTGYVGYANEASHNAFMLYFPNPRRLDVYVNGASQSVDLEITERTHLCAVVAAAQGWAKVYTNGQLLVKLSYQNPGHIEGGGILIIGQEQDNMGGGFDQTQAFSGIIENFMMWYRLLKATEVSTLADERCSCPKGHAISLRPEEIHIEGRVLAFPVDKC